MPVNVYCDYEDGGDVDARVHGINDDDDSGASSSITPIRCTRPPSIVNLHEIHRNSTPAGAR
jgi:hypothetical protein